MSKKKTKTANSSPNKISTTSKKSIPFFENHRLLIGINMAVATLVYFLFFDIRVTEAGDDSSYIQMAYNFIHYGKVSNLQAPFYAVFLGFFYWIFGMQIGLFKLLSIVSVLAGIYITYRTFKPHLPGYILHISLFIISIHYLMAYYASTTFSEGLFILLQSFFLYYAIVIFWPRLLEKNVQIKHYVVLVLLSLLLMLTRNIALVVPFSFVLFLLLQKQFKPALMYMGTFVVLYIPYYILRSIVFKSDDNQYGSQFAFIFMKDTYKPSLGNEDLGGFIQRLMDNLNLYFSKHFLKQIGFLHPDSMLIHSGIALLVIVICVAALIWVIWHKKDALSITTLYVMCMIGGTSLAMQKNWNQDRFILIYLLYLLFLLFYFFHDIASKRPAFRILKPITYVLMGAIVLAMLNRTLPKLSTHHEVWKASLKGDMTYGLTPDLKNYVLISRYAGKNVPADKKIAARKPSIAFIHGGREFSGIYAIPYVDETKAIEQGKSYCIVDFNQWTAVRDMQFRTMMLPQIKAVFQGKTDPSTQSTWKPGYYYIFFEFTPGDTLETVMKQSGLVLSQDVDEFVGAFNEKYFAVSSQLKDELISQDISYVITSSLRLNPKKKTNTTINTVERYLSFIEIKYPGCLTMVKEEGRDEKAALYELNLTQFNY
ncbi:MAG: hypothetical protein IAE67_07820 [Candidatus Competibacteraceae bacterium]|nr:hypothetical protein [Candidatus Competibacteraceae bacterium]